MPLGWLPFTSFWVDVGVVQSGQTPVEKRNAYAGVVYGTNNEFGFDYLRDNMAFSMADKAQGPVVCGCG